MHLATREGVDIKPTLLRVLTDLYVQAAGHSAEEQQHYVELASRLIGQVDDATRSAVRARLAVYPNVPSELRELLGFANSAAPRKPASDAEPPPQAEQSTTGRHVTRLSMQPGDAASIDDMFTRASPAERVQILRSLETSPLRPAARTDPRRAGQAIAVLERAAFAQDRSAFATELADALLLPPSLGERIVADESGEPLACAAKALAMPNEIFERVLLFLKPEWGSSVVRVFRLARLYASLSEQAALIVLSVWRGAAIAQGKARYRPALHDDERRRARSAGSAAPLASVTTGRTQPGRAVGSS